MRRSRRVTVSGRVQGVGFRAFVAHNAERMGVDGWVRNRKDGTVEAVIAGEATDVDAFVAACHEGPPHAKVDGVSITDGPDDVAPGFAVLPTA